MIVLSQSRKFYKVLYLQVALLGTPLQIRTQLPQHPRLLRIRIYKHRTRIRLIQSLTLPTQLQNRVPRRNRLRTVILLSLAIQILQTTGILVMFHRLRRPDTKLSRDTAQRSLRQVIQRSRDILGSLEVRPSNHKNPEACLATSERPSRQAEWGLQSVLPRPASSGRSTRR